MSAIGRNDPCPCGSGKKYKRCCLGKDAPAPGAWTTGERDSALASLMRFAQRAELDGDRAAAELTFWGKRLQPMTPAEVRETIPLRPMLKGNVQRVNFKPGQVVRKGQALIEMDLTELRRRMSRGCTVRRRHKSSR